MNETDGGAISALVIAIFAMIINASGPAVVAIAVSDAQTVDDVRTGLILAIVSLLLLPLLAIGLSFTADRRIRRSERTGGSGLASAARTISLLAIVFDVITAATFVVAMQNAKGS